MKNLVKASQEQAWWAVEIKPYPARLRPAQTWELQRATSLNWKAGIEIYDAIWEIARREWWALESRHRDL